MKKAAPRTVTALRPNSSILAPVNEEELNASTVNTVPYDLFFQDGTLALRKGQNLRGSVSSLIKPINGLFYAVTNGERQKLPFMFEEIALNISSKLDNTSTSTEKHLFAFAKTNSWVEQTLDIADYLASSFEADLDRIQAALALRRPFEEAGHAGWHPVYRACLLLKALRHLKVKDSEVRLLLAASLTADIGMVQLSSILTRQPHAPDDKQQALIATHAESSALLLRESGVDDKLWLYAVRDHHAQTSLTADNHPSETELYIQLFALCDKIAELTSYDRRRPALSLMAALVQECLTSEAKPANKAALVLLSALGPRPCGSMLVSQSGEVCIVLTPNTVVYLTTALGAVLPRFTLTPLDSASLKSAKHADYATRRRLNHVANKAIDVLCPL